MKKQGKGSQLHIVVLLLLLVTIAAYLPVFHADFVNYDDEPYVTANPLVQSGLTAEGFKWAFNVGYQGNWHPLTWLSHMLDVSLFRMDPVGHHAVNLLLHLLNTLLLFLLFNRMTKSLWKSAFVAALFAVHPMHVESVAWVAERKDVLSTLFWLLTMWAYVRYSEIPNLKRYSVMLVFFALGLMSKPTLVTLPFALLLLDYWPLNRWANARWRLVREKLPLFAMSAASCVVTYVAQQRGDAIRTAIELPFISRIENALTAYASYVSKMVWPAKLAVFYPHPVSIPIWHVMTAFLFLAAVTVLVMRAARSRPYLIVGWLWYLIVLVPMIGLVQVGRQAMADRYTYVPFIGLFIMIAWGISGSMGVWEYGSAGGRKQKSKRGRTPFLAVMSLAAVVVLAGCTWRQTGYWRDSVTLWTHTLAVTTDNDTAYYNLGTAYVKIDAYVEAVDAFKQAIRINPDDADMHNNLGGAYVKLGKYVEAVDSFKQAIRINPDNADAHYNLGADYLQIGRYAEAVDSFKQAIRIDPNYPDAHFNLGKAYGALGGYAEAVDSFKQAIRINPNYPDAHYLLGITYFLMGNKTLALDEYNALANLNPDMANKLLGVINK